MTPRQRTLEALLFGKPDRIPLNPGGGRESTRNRWYREGLPKDTPAYAIPECAYRQAGGTIEWDKGGAGFGFNTRMMPEFEEKVIERRAASQVVQDWKGNVCEISNEYDVSYLRNATDFVTRRWIKCPVESRQDWKEMKHRYVPDTPGRLPGNAGELSQSLADRDHYVGWHFSGPFWQLREWLGFEGLCMMMLDDPSFVKEMIEFWTGFTCDMLKKALEFVVPDELHLSEDMAYKSFSMISPAMAREFLKPSYLAWEEIIRKAGVPVYAMDSDGFIGELIPIWIESGFNACDPVEVAAGNDIVAFRKEFGHDIAFRGGIDKRAMAKGGDVLREEHERVRPVIEGGGYIPGCDHGVPHDVSWENYVDHVRLLARSTGWL